MVGANRGHVATMEGPQ